MEKVETVSTLKPCAFLSEGLVAEKPRDVAYYLEMHLRKTLCACNATHNNHRDGVIFVNKNENGNDGKGIKFLLRKQKRNILTIVCLTRDVRTMLLQDVRPISCPSIRPSQAGFVSKCLNIIIFKLFHHRVATPF